MSNRMNTSLHQKRSVRLFVLVMWIGVQVAFAQSDTAWMNNPKAFDGLNPENLQERLGPWLDSIANETDPDRQSHKYAFLAGAIASRGFMDDASLDVIISLADKALALDLSPTDRKSVSWHKATMIRRKHRNKEGEALRAPRREMATQLLEGYKAGLDVCRNFKAKNPGFDGKGLMPQQPAQPGGYLHAGRPPGYAEYQKKWDKLVGESRMCDRLMDDFPMMENDLVDVYSRAPYDLAELNDLTREILADSTIADRMVAAAKKEIMRRELLKAGQGAKKVEEEIMKGVNLSVLPEWKPAEISSAADAPVSNKDPGSAPLAQKSEVSDETDGASNLIWIALGGILIFVGIAAAVWFLRRRR